MIELENLKATNVLQDGIGSVELYDYMGSEKTITDRARICYLSEGRSSPEGDRRLLRQLVVADLIHGTPLRAVQFLFRVKLPLFVMRQWTRHIVGNYYDVLEFSSLGHHTFDWGGSFDEMSGRYVDFAKQAEFYNPGKLRKLSEKQMRDWEILVDNARLNYNGLRSTGFPKELARCHIPQSIYTYMNWSVNLQGIMTWYEHRKKGSGAQVEHVAYAEAVLGLAKEIVPNVIEDFLEKLEK